jgi:hypothetical protein
MSLCKYKGCPNKIVIGHYVCKEHLPIEKQVMQQIRNDLTKKKQHIHKLNTEMLAPLTDITLTPEQMFTMQPGDYYNFFRYQLAFYDFAIHPRPFTEPSQVNCKSKGDTLTASYIEKHYAKTRFYINVTLTSEEGDIYPQAFLLCEQLSPTDLYISSVCASAPMSDKKTANEGQLKTSFGVLLQFILLTYAKQNGFKNVYLDAAGKDLINYYTRFGYRIGKEMCGVADRDTATHQTALNNNEARFYQHLDATYPTTHGYRMKLCNFNKYDLLAIYAHHTLENTSRELTLYDDFFTN